MAITPLPTPPSRSQSPATFSTDADAFLGALPAFASEANALATDVNADEASAAASATTASNAASVAVGAANYQGDYNAGTTYQIGESVSYSGRRYVAKTINTGVTPADGANWFLINDGDVLGPVSATNNALVLYDGTTGKIIKNGPAPGTAGNIIVSNGTTWASQAFPPVAGSISANAASNVTIRQPLIVQSNGEVAPVTGFGPSISAEFALTGGISAFWQRVAYNPTENRFLIVYFNGGAVFCVVAQVTASSVTYGTPVQVSPGESCWDLEVCYNSTSNRFVIAYFSNSQGGVQVHAVSVSGLNATVGTRVAIGSSQNGHCALASHPSSATVAIAYADSGLQLRALEFTISGNTISFNGTNGATGKYGAFNSQSTLRNISIAYQGATISPFVWAIAYADSSSALQLFILSMSSGQPNSIGTNVQISGFGQSPTVLWDSALSRLFIASRDTVVSTTVANPPAIVAGTSKLFNPPNGSIYPVHMYYDTTANVYTVVFRNTSANNFLQTVNFTATQTTLTILSPVRTISTDSADYMGSAYSSSIGMGLAVWRGSGGLLKSSIINSSAVTNLTTTNFVGFAGATATTGQSVSVQTIGSSVAGFSGLTAASPYYVRIDGTLATTPDPNLASPVYAGLALSASSLLVKG